MCNTSARTGEDPAPPERSSAGSPAPPEPPQETVPITPTPASGPLFPVRKVHSSLLPVGKRWGVRSTTRRKEMPTSATPEKSLPWISLHRSRWGALLRS